MRIAYVTVNMEPQLMLGGVGSKIKRQIEIWRERGHQVTLFSVTPGPISFPDARQFMFVRQTNVVSRELSRAGGLQRMFDSLREWKPDIIYLRFGLYTYPLHRLFQIAPVVLDVNTDDLGEYATRGKFLYWLNRLTRNRTFLPAAGIVLPSHELTRILPDKPGQQFTVISNGVNLTGQEVLEAPHNDRPVITLVASPGLRWHGADKLIELARELPDIDFHLVGYSPAEISAPVPPNMTVSGFLSHSEIRPIYQRTDVACGTLALHRKQMDEASPLKVREALAFGIPVILAYRDTDLDDIEMDTILRIPNTETNTIENADRIRDFAYRMMGARVNVSTLVPRLDQRKKEDARLSFFNQVLGTHAHG